MENNHSTHQPEAFARVLIDRALSDSEWDLLNPQQVKFEFHTPTGRADYLLKDSLGRVLCVLEAKREDLDPYDACINRNPLVTSSIKSWPTCEAKRTERSA
jgi:predicted type IV restriction endonuclease